MFYISPWMLLGLILGTVYFVLVLFGYEENRHEKRTRKKSEGKLAISTQTSKDISEEKQGQTTDEKPGEDERRKEPQSRKSDAAKQIGEVTFSSCQTSQGTNKSFDGLKLAPAAREKSEGLVAEQKVETVKTEVVLQSQDALYLQEEFDVSTDSIFEGQGIRTSSRGSEDLTEISGESKLIKKHDESGLLEAQDGESTEIVTQTVCTSVSSAPLEHKFGDIAEPQKEQSTVPSCVKESNSSTDLEQSDLFGDFADHLVSRAKMGAFYDIDLESKANYLAGKISTEIVCDAIGQLAAGSISVDQEIESPNIQELHSFAGSVIDSLIQEVTGKVSLVNDVESFARDLSEQVVIEGMGDFAAMEKLRQGRKQKLSLNEMKIFSEGIVSETISDAIEEAVGGVNIEGFKSADKHLPKATDSVAHQAALSSSIQPHISGVVENVVNGAIYEASLRVKAQNSEAKLEDSSVELCAQELLESQVSETVQELIVSALHQAADYKGKLKDDSSLEDKSELESHVVSFVDDALDAAVSEAAGKVEVEERTSDQEGKLLNGHVDLSLESSPEVIISAESEAQMTDLNQGVDEVPLKENELRVEERQKGAGDRNNYWRQSLILDLEGDEEEFDESLESERSQPSATESPSTPMDKEIVSDEAESNEFIDSSEDEVIDHAEDAKLGAVGGLSAKKYDNDDDDDEYDDDEEEEDGNEDDLLFAGQTMVDGLCASKPKEKRKKKQKSKLLSRPRIQSDPEGYVLSAKKNENAGSHYNTAVVLDNGSGIIKLGLAGSKMPTVVQPALYGIPKRYSLQMAGMDNKKDRQYGESATARAGVMQLEYPMTSGFLENWSDVEDIWEYMLCNELGIEEGNHPVLLTEVANTPKKNRERMAEILFEHLGVPAMYLANQLVLSLYASGLTLGMCLSSGFSVTQAAAIYEGYLLAYTVQELDIGGKALTDNLQKLLRENKGHNFNSSSGWQIVNRMKEEMTYISQDYSSELKKFKTSDAMTQFYSLPDGQKVEISSEMVTTPEPLFNPETLLGADDTVASQMPVHRLVNSAFRRCSPELQDSMCRNVVLSGGTTLMKGLVPRLEHELGKINPKIRSVRAPDNRMYSAWIGGSILGSLSTLDSMYATIDEYADYGGRIINQKCF